MPTNLLDISALLPRWQRVLRVERKSPATLRSYTDGVTNYLKWCTAEGVEPDLTRESVEEYVVSMMEDGAEASSIHTRLKGLRRFTAWLASEGITEADPLAGMRSPKLDKKVVNALSDDQLKALIKACKGTKLADRRDEALVRFMLDTGARASEVVGLQMADIDLDRQTAIIRRGKGGKGRVVPLGDQTMVALDRYLWERRHHRLANSGPLWVGAGGKTFGYFGLSGALKARAEAAGIEGFHCHLLRHTFATRWKRAAGSDDGLMAIAGWSSRTMIDRYTGAAAAERAAEESRRLNLGDL